MVQPIQITVGGDGAYDPIAGDTEYNNPDLAGINGFVDKSGYGTWGYENYQILSTGGFELLNGLTFTNGEVMFFHPTSLNYNTTVTGYTNGFYFNKVINALFGRVGWMQAAGSDNPTLNSTNLLSKSGRYFNDGSFHSLCTLLNLKAVMELSDATDNQFNAFIEQLQKSVILRCLNGVFSEPEYISQGLLYRTNRYSQTTIDNNGQFVGVRFKVPPVSNIATQLDSVSLLFNGDVTFNLYLFHESKLDPVSTIEVEATANTQTVVDLYNIVLNFINSETLSGNFYLGYFQDDLGSVKAIREQDIIITCNQPFGFSMFESDATGATSFNRDEIAYTSVPHGLNVHVSCFRDHTWQIVKKAGLFDNVIGLQMAAQIVEQVMFSSRSNSGERALKDQVNNVIGMMELDGSAPISDGPVTTGLRKQITQELQRVKKSFHPTVNPQTVSLC
jgi:hypothetical protein